MTHPTESEAGVGVAETTEAGISEASGGKAGVLRESRVDTGGEDKVIETGVHKVRIETWILEVEVESGVLKISIEAGVLEVQIEAGVRERPEETTAAESTATEATPSGEQTGTGGQNLRKEASLSCKARGRPNGRGTESTDTSKSC